MGVSAKRIPFRMTVLVILTMATGCRTSEETFLPMRSGPRVGILPFEVKGELGEDMGRLAQDILISAFFERTSFPIIERGKLDRLFIEQDIGDGNRNLLPLEAVVQGHITALGPSNESRNYLLWQSQSCQTQVVLDVRCIDVKSGEVLFSGKRSLTIDTSDNLTIIYLWTVHECERDLSEHTLREAIEEFLEYSVDQIEIALKRAHAKSYTQPENRVSTSGANG